MLTLPLDCGVLVLIPSVSVITAYRVAASKVRARNRLRDDRRRVVHKPLIGVLRRIVVRIRPAGWYAVESRILVT